MKNGKYMLPRAESPESVGVSSAVIKEMIEGIEKNNLEFHSIMLVRHGKVAFEFFRKPFSAKSPHAMYSASKSWTATAIGIAIDEGYFTLDSKVIDFFPEFVPKFFDSKLDKLLVKHLLTMTSGKNINLLADKSKIDWIKQFFSSPWNHEPGEKFIYTNENSFILAAMIKRATGLTVREFLKPRLFDPLGIDVPFWETEKNNIEAGGWGLYAKTEDLAKLMLCYQQGGYLNNRQILSKEWIDMASSCQADNSDNGGADASEGYGYSFWQCTGIKNAYRADGMFAQFGIVMNDYDSVLTVTSGIALEQEALDYLWKFFPKAFFDETKEEKETVKDFKKFLNYFPIDKPKKSYHSPMEKDLIGKTITIMNKKYLDVIGFPLSIMPIPVTYMTTDKAGNPDNLQLAFNDNILKFRWTEGDEINTVYCGMDGKMRGGKITLGQIDYDVCAYAFWENDYVLQIQIRPYTTIAKRILRLIFDGKNVTIVVSSTPNISETTRFLGEAAGDLIKDERILKIIPTFLGVLSKAVEPTLTGRIR